MFGDLTTAFRNFNATCREYRRQLEETRAVWMTDYIREIKRQFRDVYHFTPVRGTLDDPTFAEGAIPDGEYPMTIEGKLDRVRIEGGEIKCCNFDGEGR
jgi:hypothetical protein